MRIIIPGDVPPINGYAIPAPRRADAIVGALNVAFARHDDLPVEFINLLAVIDRVHPRDI